MERVKHHMRIIEGALSGSVVVPSHPDRETLLIETVFLHFRKALEERNRLRLADSEPREVCCRSAQLRERLERSRHF